MAEITDPTLLDALNGGQKKSGEITDPDLLAHLNGTTAPRPTPRFVNPRGGAYNPNDYTAPDPGGVLRAFGQGVSGGFSDEAEAALKAVNAPTENVPLLHGGRSTTKPVVSPEADKSFVDRYYDEKKKIDERAAQDKQTLGPGYTAMEFLGSVAPAAAAGRAVSTLAPAGSGVLRRIGANVAVNGGLGAAQDIGAQDTGNVDLGEAAGVGALSGVLGGALTAAERPAALTYDFFRNKINNAMEDAAVKRWVEAGAQGQMPVSERAQREAIHTVTNALQDNSIGEQQFANQAQIARLPGEQDVAPVVVNPVMRELGRQTVKDLPSETFGGRGNMTQRFRDESLRDANGASQVDNLRSRVESHLNLPHDPADRVVQHNQQLERFSQALGNLVNSGGGTRVRGAQDMIDAYPWFRQDYVRAQRTFGLPIQYDPNDATRIVIPGDTMDIRTAHQLRGLYSENSMADAPRVTRDRALIGTDFVNDAADQQGAAGRLRRAARINQNMHAIHNAQERMTEGSQFAERNMQSQANATGERRAMARPAQLQQSEGVLYKLSDDINNAAASGDASGEKLRGVANDYFGTLDKARSFREWVQSNRGTAADTTFASQIDNDLRKIGMRHEVAAELHKLLTEQRPGNQEQLRGFMRMIKGFAYSTKLGGLANAIQNMTQGMSTMRKYQVARLLYDKTAQGEQEILREFQRRAAQRAAPQQLSRKAILNYLATSGLTRAAH